MKRRRALSGLDEDIREHLERETQAAWPDEESRARHLRDARAAIEEATLEHRPPSVGAPDLYEVPSAVGHPQPPLRLDGSLTRPW